MRQYTDDAIGGYVGYKPGPGWLYSKWASRWIDSIGMVANAVAQASKDAALSLSPLYASESALSYHVLERTTPRFETDTSVGLRARLTQGPWVPTGTFAGLKTHLKLAGIPASVLRFGSPGDVGYSPTRYQIVVTGLSLPHPWGRVGDPGATVGDGRRVVDQVDARARIERTCARYQAAQCKLLRVTLVLSGATVGDGSAVGSVVHPIGGETITWDYSDAG